MESGGGEEADYASETPNQWHPSEWMVMVTSGGYIQGKGFSTESIALTLTIAQVIVAQNLYIQAIYSLINKIGGMFFLSCVVFQQRRMWVLQAIPREQLSVHNKVVSESHTRMSIGTHFPM